jgi:hypothetical protein
VLIGVAAGRPCAFGVVTAYAARRHLFERGPWDRGHTVTPALADAGWWRGGLTRAICVAIDASIFDGCTRAEACKNAAITKRALYLGLEKAEVAAYWRRQTDVLGTGERAAKSPRARSRPRLQWNPAASVKAVQVLEQLDDEAVKRPPSMQQSPGLVIVVANADIRVGSLRRFRDAPRSATKRTSKTSH